VSLLPTPAARFTVVSDGTRYYAVAELSEDEAKTAARHLARRSDGEARDEASREFRDVVANAIRLHTLPERIAHAGLPAASGVPRDA
jgi:hypothetical protein